MNHSAHIHHDPDQILAPVSGPGRMLLNILGIFLLSVPALFVLSVLTFLLAAFTNIAASIFSFISLLCLGLVAAAVRRLRAECSGRLLGYLGLAARQNLPIPEFLDALQRGEGPGMRRRARLIAEDMRLGATLGEALFAHAPEIPAHQTSIIWRGEYAGRLSESIDHVASRASNESRDAQSSRSDIATQYALFLFVALLGVAGAASIFVIPNYIEIFADFGIDIPEITRITFFWIGNIGPLISFLAVGALMAVVGWSAYTMFHSSENVIGPLRRMTERLWWHMPLCSISYRNRAWADACFLIEQAMRAGRPLPEAIDVARHPVHSSVVNSRLRMFASLLREGAPMPKAARDANLPALIAGMLGTASDAVDPADVFAFLSRYYAQRVTPVEALLRASALPIITLLASILVGWFVFSIFYPLVVLIEQTAKESGYW